MPKNTRFLGPNEATLIILIVLENLFFLISGIIWVCFISILTTVNRHEAHFILWRMFYLLFRQSRFEPVK